ncbi:MAG: J domain-containing protein [Acidimicrobiales bacterium]|nr:J domain-containing protein [Acidimicrobiales bacterium]
MVIRRPGGKRRHARDAAPGGAAHDDADDRDEPDTPSEDDDLDTRLGAVSSRFERTPTAEELRAAFSRKSSGEPGEMPRRDFASTYTSESLFSSTVDDLTISDPDLGPGEDRSRTAGDYYYDPDDAWDVLGVRPGADWEEIAAAHRRLAKEHHPDRVQHQAPELRAESEARMRDINVAYTVLRRLAGR